MPSHHYGLIMAGRRGTRFWPRSRRRSAKQVLRFFGDRSLIQQTVDRLAGVIPPERIWVITNQFLLAEIRKQLPQVPGRQIIAEPVQRNTSPCIALAAHILSEIDPAAVFGVFPSDHLIQREANFNRYVRAAFKAAEKASVVILGIQPRWADTGFGYIEFPANTQPGAMAPLPVTKFFEKPDKATAEKYVKRGNFFWNAGMFFWRASAVLDLVRRHQPKTATLLAGLPKFGDSAFARKLKAAYPLCDDISVDYAILEKMEGVSGIAVDDIGWSDVGSWEAVYELSAKDGEGNACRGDLIAEDSRGNFIDSRKLVALVGVENLAIIETPDALLIAARDKTQGVSKIVKTLEARGREDLL